MMSIANSNEESRAYVNVMNIEMTFKTSARAPRSPMGGKERIQRKQTVAQLALQQETGWPCKS